MSSYHLMATFAPGFETCISSVLFRSVPDAKNLRVFSGMILFTTDQIPLTLLDAGFFNNIFLIAKEWNSPSISFTDMINSSIQKNCLVPFKTAVSNVIHSSFRVRFSKANQFTKVDRSLVERSELFISKSLDLKTDRLSSGTEFWFLIRNEGLSFFMIRLTQRDVSLNELHQGELRPETAFLLVAYSSPHVSDLVVLDPFAGYGSIPEQMHLLLPNARIYVSDSDETMVEGLIKRFEGNKNIETHLSDARNLSFITTGSVNLVVTDPPWGVWKSETYSQDSSIVDLYSGFLSELDRILSFHGRACILTGAKREFEEAVSLSSSFAHNIGNKGNNEKPGFRTDILVNGKKTAVFLINR